ncbi:hypothetical protein J7E88_12775 [Streptomyces sp. ISL-10]|uniref:DUF6624 domain-containing protein n=1 Tax=Streptomyces sp. ISL-10 TaxID=2819172 RepID=UPI001BEA1A1C|nr:DUF6624 domain-containing protein [Streptomyces sp. ISL-10]MBT2366157.1 hypothetical protein [Streptomyces sp. ISL-10]
MTTEPQRQDIASDLLDRAEKAREFRSKRSRDQLSQAEISMGRHGDHANAQVLRRVVADHGWPGRSLVGEDAADAAWQIVLHADHLPDFQRLALRMMVTAVERGEATIQQWAHLHDRCSINSGTAQTYGTQYRIGPNGVEALPVREPERLDARRASVSLPPSAAAYEALRRRHAREPETEQARDDDSATAELLGSAA